MRRVSLGVVLLLSDTRVHGFLADRVFPSYLRRTGDVSSKWVSGYGLVDPRRKETLVRKVPPLVRHYKSTKGTGRNGS